MQEKDNIINDRYLVSSSAIISYPNKGKAVI